MTKQRLKASYQMLTILLFFCLPSSLFSQHLYNKVINRNKTELIPLGKEKFIFKNNTFMTLQVVISLKDGKKRETLKPNSTTKAYDTSELIKISVSLSKKDYKEYIQLIDYFLKQCLDFDPGKPLITPIKVRNDIKFYRELQESGFGDFTHFPSKISPCYNLFLVRKMVEECYRTPNKTYLKNIFDYNSPLNELKDHHYYRAYNPLFIVEGMFQSAGENGVQYGSLFEHSYNYTLGVGIGVSPEIHLFGKKTFSKLYVMGNYRAGVINTRGNFDTILINPDYYSSPSGNSSQVLDYSGLNFEVKEIDLGLRLRTTFRERTRFFVDLEGGYRLWRKSSMEIVDPSIPDGLTLTQTTFNEILDQPEFGKTPYFSAGLNFGFKWRKEHPHKLVAKRGFMIRLGGTLTKRNIIPNTSFPLYNNDNSPIELSPVLGEYLRTIDLGMTLML